ncbi:hypothetical protein SGRI78S_04434 [Streptomyces griseus subsp. griseus]
MPDRADARTETDATEDAAAGASAGGAGETRTAVRVQGLWKRFGDQVAVAGIDLELPAGKFVGLVGPNGAGKTTTLSMVTGLLRPDMGRIEVAGHDVWTDPVEVKSRIGVLPEGLRLFERLSGRELLAYNGRLRGLPGDEVDKRATQLLDVLDLAGSQHKLVVDYSTGMRKKIGLDRLDARHGPPRRAVADGAGRARLRDARRVGGAADRRAAHGGPAAGDPGGGQQGLRAGAGAADRRPGAAD